MSVRDSITQLLNMVVYLAFQLLLFRNNAIFDIALCFIYVALIILMPLSLPPILYMTIAFFYGLLVDSFYDTMGIHAFSCVMIAFLRPHVINFLTPKGGYEGGGEITITQFGTQWFVIYAGSMALIHHLCLFTLEYWGSNIFRGIISAILSAIFTLSIMLLFQYLFKKTGR